MEEAGKPVPFKDLVKAAMFATPAHAAQRVARVGAELGEVGAHGLAAEHGGAVAVAGADDAIRLRSQSSREKKSIFVARLNIPAARGEGD
jgi:hypothetical protein